MKNYSQLIKQRKIKLVFLQFCDLFGTVKGVYIPVSKLDDAIKNGISFDGSSIKCYGKTKNSDKKVYVDSQNFYILPNNILTFFCYVKTKYDPRLNLHKMCNKLEKLGYKIQTSAELEFYLFDQQKGKVNLKKLERVGYFSEINLKKLNALNEICHLLNSQNFFVEAIHHECGKNQYEINFKFDTPLKTADKVIIAKQVIKQIAKKHHLYASFMPKPINFLAGNGMHINLSILRNNKNIFYDTTQKYNLSAFATDFANNVSKHIGAICAFSNPIINSYKRLNANMETPTSVRLGYKDRQSSCRIPQFSEATARVEFRFPDAACQVYLTLCAIIASGFENIFNKTTQTIIAPKSLPKSLNESLRFLKQDKFIGKFVPKSYFAEVNKQLAEYESQITSYEIKKYL